MTTSIRPDLGKFTSERLAEAWDEAWERHVALRAAAAYIGEELLARIISTNLPAASTVVLFRDTSHGDAHAHLKQVEDADGNVIAAGVGDAWHQMEWTTEVDDYVFELFPLIEERFTPMVRGGEEFVGYTFPISVPPAQEAHREGRS